MYSRAFQERELLKVKKEIESHSKSIEYNLDALDRVKLKLAFGYLSLRKVDGGGGDDGGGGGGGGGERGDDASVGSAVKKNVFTKKNSDLAHEFVKRVLFLGKYYDVQRDDAFTERCQNEENVELAKLARKYSRGKRREEKKKEGEKEEGEKEEGEKEEGGKEEGKKEEEEEEEEEDDDEEKDDDDAIFPRIFSREFDRKIL